MKNFSELLATKLELHVVVNGAQSCAGLHDRLVFDGNDTVTIDGIEVLPKYHYLVENNQLTISEPFYCWYHQVSGQGWLLTPTGELPSLREPNETA